MIHTSAPLLTELWKQPIYSKGCWHLAPPLLVACTKDLHSTESLDGLVQDRNAVLNGYLVTWKSIQNSCFSQFSFSRSVVSHSLGPHGLWLARLLCPLNSPGKNTRVGSHSLLQGIFPTQGLNQGIPRCRQIIYHLSHQGSPFRIQG